MAFTVTGIATVSDVRDGVSPPTIYLTNENHTFVASSAGVVADLSGFSTSAQVFVGSTQYTYVSKLLPQELSSLMVTQQFLQALI